MNYSRREFLKTTGIAALSLGIPGLLQKCAQPARRPNIVVIMADDMGYSDIGCYGGEINTPNIDSLAENGIRFTQFYNAARCCPTRASLLTGVYPHQAGMGGMVSTSNPPGPYQGYLNTQSVTIAEVLKDAGYTTLMSGKWHVGEEQPHWPTDRGFDRYFGLISGAANYFDISRTKRPDLTRTMALDGEEYTPPDEGFYMTDAFTDYAVQFLDEHGGDENPFFLYLAYTAPHWPLHAWPEDIAKYEGKYMSGWEQLRAERYKRMVEMGIINQEWELSPPDSEVIPWDEIDDKALMDRKMAVYAAQVDSMDQGIGKVLDKIDELGKMDNTLIMFLSDNGGCHEENVSTIANEDFEVGSEESYTSYGRDWANASNTPFRMYKHWVHEGGIATPLVVQWPEVIQSGGELTDEVGHIMDIMATCCEVAGTEYPATRNEQDIVPLQGKSLLPVLQGGEREGYDTLFWEHLGNRAVRQGRWKLVSRDRGDWELYDMIEDRSELNNVANQQPELTEEMALEFMTWAEQVGVRI